MTPATPSGYSSPKTNINGYKQAQLPNFTPQQMQLFQQLLGSVGGGAQGGIDYLSKLAGGDESMFEGIEAPSYSAFNKFAGEAANRFSGLGARDSSGFENTLGSGAAQLAEGLGARRQGLQQNAIESLLSQSNSLLNQRPYENLLVADSQNKGFDWQSILGQVLPGILSAFGGPLAGGGASAIMALLNGQKNKVPPPAVGGYGAASGSSSSIR